MDIRQMARAAAYTIGRQASMAGVKAFGHASHYNVPGRRVLEQGLLIASNHQSFWDPSLIGAGLPRHICYLARSTLFEVPLFGAMISTVNAYPVRRGRVDSQALRTVMRLLRRGEALLMFPEGTRSRDGSLGRFRPGAASIARRMGVPILPVCVEGSFDSWPRDRTLPRPAPMAVAYGELMDTSRGSAEELTDRLRQEICEMQRFLRAQIGPGGRCEE